MLHPGTMGAAVGAALKPSAGAVLWAVAGRSQATAKRAELADLIGVPDVAELARRSDVIVSVCPPHAARDVAGEVANALAGTKRRPLYVDANAVSPATVRAIGELLGPDRVVDASIIGPPAWEPGRTVIWLSGAAAGEVAELFTGSPFTARTLGPELGAASALKACFALHTKVVAAIRLEAAAAARGYGVAAALEEELARMQVAAVRLGADQAAEKAWRWAGEMDEAAETMTALGLPDGFSRAAGEIFRRVASGELHGDGRASQRPQGAQRTGNPPLTPPMRGE